MQTEISGERKEETQEFSFQMSFALPAMKKNINNTKLWTLLADNTLFLLRGFDDNDVFAFHNNLLSNCFPFTTDGYLSLSLCLKSELMAHMIPSNQSDVNTLRFFEKEMPLRCCS
jgi:hypothetical protein